MIFVTAIFLFVLVSLALYLYMAGAFNMPSLTGFQFTFYILLILFALTIGLGAIYDRPATTPLSVSEILPQP